MVTTAEQIKGMIEREVQITGFNDDFITLKLRSISLTGLIAKGKIPNMLLGKSIELFEGKESGKEVEKEEAIKKTSELIDLVCENIMVEPTFAEIAEYLNDKQKMEIFYYSQGGLSALESFRTIKNTDNDIEHSTAIQPETKRVSRNKK
jgi:hypothetical protein